jgi:DNA replication protein DnaC
METPKTEPSTLTPQPEKIIPNHYDYPKILQLLEQRGKEQFGQHFRFRKEDEPIILRLIAYFLKDEMMCNKAGISLQKGILLSGPVGCGKTTLMNLMRFVSQSENKFILKSCRDISFEFIQDGYEVIHRYSKGKLYESNVRNYCFDDLGTENNLKYYGNECNVMAEILLSRYDLFVSRKLQTHITTNLSASEIEKHYGNRVRSRLREMVNLVAFDKEITDKRK